MIAPPTFWISPYAADATQLLASNEGFRCRYVRSRSPDGPRPSREAHTAASPLTMSHENACRVSAEAEPRERHTAAQPTS